MTITLPRLPRSAEYELRLIESTDVQRSTNGVALPLSRPGDHFELEVDVGSLTAGCAWSLTVDLLRGRGETVRVFLPKQGVDVGTPGALVVDGADQSGALLAVRGGTPNAAIGKWPITVITGGTGRLYLIAEETILDAAGAAALPLWPMLRVPPADGDTIEILDPFIEGLRKEGGELAMGLVRAGKPGSFVVEEQD